MTARDVLIAIQSVYPVHEILDSPEIYKCEDIINCGRRQSDQCDDCLSRIYCKMLTHKKLNRPCSFLNFRELENLCQSQQHS